MWRILGLLITGIVALGGCATGEPGLSVSPRDVSGTSCASLTLPPDLASLSLPSSLSTSSLSAVDRPPIDDGLSSEARHIAEIIGVLPLVQETRELAGVDPGGEGETRQRLFELQQYLSNQMMTTFFEVSSVASRIDCEAIRANHVATTLTEIREQRSQRYEVAAIVGDAVIGIVGGALTLGVSEIAAAIADIGGGVFAAGFGLAAGFTSEEHEYHAPQNFLRELWENPQAPTLFSQTVWRFLNWPLGDQAEYSTKRNELIAEWQNDGFIAQSGTTNRRTDLLFSTAGLYEIEDLRIRAQMLEELKTYVNVMVQQLHLLSREVLSFRRVTLQ